MHISIQNAIVTVEWESAYQVKRKDKVDKHSTLLFFFQFKLSGAVKNCVFAASSENLKFSFEKLQCQLWSSPIQFTHFATPSQTSANPSDSQLGRVNGLSQHQMRQDQQQQPVQKQHSQQHATAALQLSSFSTTSLAAALPSQDAPSSGPVVNSVGDKKAKIAAILNAKGGKKQSDLVPPSALADIAAFPSKQPAIPSGALQQHPDSVAESSLLAEMRFSIDQLTAQLQQQSIQLAHSHAAASAAESITAAAQTERRESLSKLASVVSDLEKCKVELEMKKAQGSAQQQKLAAAASFAEKQNQALKRSEATVAELETELKEVAAANALLKRDLELAHGDNAAITLELDAAKATISHLTKTKTDACVGYDAIPPEDDGVGYFSLKDNISESRLLVDMAEKGVIVMRHRNQLLLDRFYESEAVRFHRILTSAKKRHVTFKSQLDVGEFCINDAPDSVSLARKTVSDSKLDATDKLLQKRRKKCEGQIKWQHAEAQALCFASHSMCLSPEPATSIVPPILGCKGKVISSSDLQKWFAVALSCTKFDLHAPIRSPQLAPLRDRSHSSSMDHAPDGLNSIDAALGGLSQISLCQLFFAFRGCSTLRSIDFSFNSFSELCAVALGSLLATACIADLRLSFCDITSSYIPRMQFGVPWLTELDVSNNDIRDEGLLSLTFCLQTETCSLRKLNCANNSLSGVSCKTLSSALDLNSSLQSLILDDNVSSLRTWPCYSVDFSSPFRFWRKAYLICSVLLGQLW